jgi:hypothetical protein
VARALSVYVVTAPDTGTPPETVLIEEVKVHEA